MATSETLRQTLYRIDGRGYKAYKDIAGTYQFADFTLTVDYVQGDPFAAPKPVAGSDPACGGRFFRSALCERKSRDRAKLLSRQGVCGGDV